MFHKMLFVAGDARRAAAMTAQLNHVVTLETIFPRQFDKVAAAGNILVDIDLSDDLTFLEVKKWIASAVTVNNLIILIDSRSPIDSIRGTELKATNLCPRPANRADIMCALLGDFDALSSDGRFRTSRESAAVAPAVNALESVFSCARFGTPLDLMSVQNSNAAVVDQISACGLEKWLNIVRQHHSRTYQHSLIVIGVTAEFCKRLGFSQNDQERLCLGALLHDVGKAQVPVSILEKPAALDPRETEEMRKHPRLGHEALQEATDIHPAILQIVLRHHEYLDGSGYPNRLMAHEITDPVRIITICDVFSALIERRSYKAALSVEAAIAQMTEMGAKLDRAILREFSFTSELQLVA